MTAEQFAGKVIQLWRVQERLTVLRADAAKRGLMINRAACCAAASGERMPVSRDDCAAQFDLRS